MTVRIGALHADAWAGLVLSDRPGEGFGLRFAVERTGPYGSEILDFDDFFWLVHDVGPHDPEGRYARVSFDLDLPRPEGPEGQPPPVAAREGREPGLVLEWARVRERTVVGRVTVPRAPGGFEGALLLRGWFPWDWTGAWSRVGDGALVGTSASGESAVGAWIEPRATGPGGSGSDGSESGASESGASELGASESGGSAADADGLTLRVPVRPGTAIRFAAAIAPTSAAARERVAAVDPDSVPGILDRAAADYEGRRARVAGALEGLAAAVTENIHWMVLLQPETGRTYTPAGRRWIFPRAEERGGGRDHWTVFGWDSYFNALELAVEAPAAARETLLSALRTAYPNGCVPNWRGRFGGTPDRSQPPIGSLAALKLHLRRPDLEMLEEAYPLLRSWSDWWVGDPGPRDGSNGATRRAGSWAASGPVGQPRRAPGPRGLMTWGSDRDRIDPHAPPWERDVGIRQLAAWESGQDDLPTWDEVAPVEDAGCLDVDPVDASAYRVLDLECLAAIAARLGRDAAAAAHRRAAAELRRRVNQHLWDPDRETYADRRWDGSFTACRTAGHFLVLAAGIPPADRARRMLDHLTDPALFWGDYVVPTISRDDPRFQEQQYWRGTIWPPINYLIHLGLARYGSDAEAAAVAERGARMFLADRRRTGLCRENFDSRAGEGAGQRHQSWGPLFALTALEELADVTPWDGLRVGGLRPASRTELTNADFGPHGRLDVATGPEGLALRVDGEPVLGTDAPVVLRRLELGTERVAARVSCETSVSLRVELPGPRWSVVVDGRREERSEPVVRLPPGGAAVEVRTLG